jgi:hypothetical protein
MENAKKINEIDWASEKFDKNGHLCNNSARSRVYEQVWRQVQGKVWASLRTIDWTGNEIDFTYIRTREMECAGRIGKYEKR